MRGRRQYSDITAAEEHDPETVARLAHYLKYLQNKRASYDGRNLKFYRPVNEVKTKDGTTTIKVLIKKYFGKAKL